MVTVSKQPEVVGDILGRDTGTLITLFLLIGLLAGIAGWIAARALSSPFQRLAVAAAALGRGRFDLDLPKTRVPEAQAIGKALQTSAHELQSRLSRERDFAEHASHVLKTPLTGLRLELEDMTLRDDVPEDAKAAAARCLRSVDAVNRSAGELVALSRRGSLVEGAELTLHDLATQQAQRWADQLAEKHRQLSASADGDLEMALTPGPVEHVLDLVLSDVVQDGKGPVKITFLGEHDHLRIRMPAGVVASGARRRRRRQPGAGIAEARQVVEAQGGRVTGNGRDEDLEILLPRR
jgi:signal transduction histidine kinase